MALLSGVLAALTPALRATEPIVLEALTVKLEAAGARTVAVLGKGVGIQI